MTTTVTSMDLAVDALAAHRVTRLIVSDKITENFRGRIVRAAYRARGDEFAWSDDGKIPKREWAVMPKQDADAPMLAYFMTCPWCVGMYVSAGVAVAQKVAPRFWNPIARVLAASSVAGLLSGHERA